MSGRRINLPSGTTIKDGKVVPPGPKPRDASEAKSWAKGGKKGKRRVVSKAAAWLFNSIGKRR